MTSYESITASANKEIYMVYLGTSSGLNRIAGTELISAACMFFRSSSTSKVERRVMSLPVRAISSCADEAICACFPALLPFPVYSHLPSRPLTTICVYKSGNCNFRVFPISSVCGENVTIATIIP